MSTRQSIDLLVLGIGTNTGCLVISDSGNKSRGREFCHS